MLNWVLKNKNWREQYFLKEIGLNIIHNSKKMPKHEYPYAVFKKFLNDMKIYAINAGRKAGYGVGYEMWKKGKWVTWLHAGSVRGLSESTQPCTMKMETFTEDTRNALQRTMTPQFPSE